MSVADPFGLVGQVLDGQFRVDKLVGEGGFSAVYRGHHQGLNEPIAIKSLKLPSSLAPSLVDTFVQRFRDESRILYRLSQGNLHVVRSIAAGTTQAPTTGALVPYMVLEWLEGRSVQNDFTVRRTLGQTGRSLEEILKLFETAADGLAYAHAQGVVHRDLNPGNLFLASTQQGVKMKVLDFGVAKLMHEGALNMGPRQQTVGQIKIFAPAYGAPEQFDDRIGTVGAFSDVYAFALILIEALRDKCVNEGTHIGEFAQRACDPAHRPTPRALGVNVPDEVEAAFARATTLDPKERWQSAGDFWKSLTIANKFAIERRHETAARETPPLAMGGPALQGKTGPAIAKKNLDRTIPLGSTAPRPRTPTTIGIPPPDPGSAPANRAPSAAATIKPLGAKGSSPGFPAPIVPALGRTMALPTPGMPMSPIAPPRSPSRPPSSARNPALPAVQPLAPPGPVAAEGATTRRGTGADRSPWLAPAPGSAPASPPSSGEMPSTDPLPDLNKEEAEDEPTTVHAPAPEILRTLALHDAANARAAADQLIGREKASREAGARPAVTAGAADAEANMLEAAARSASTKPPYVEAPEDFPEPPDSGGTLMMAPVAQAPHRAPGGLGSTLAMASPLGPGFAPAHPPDWHAATQGLHAMPVQAAPGMQGIPGAHGTPPQGVPPVHLAAGALPYGQGGGMQGGAPFGAPPQQQPQPPQGGQGGQSFARPSGGQHAFPAPSFAPSAPPAPPKQAIPIVPIAVVLALLALGGIGMGFVALRARHAAAHADPADAASSHDVAPAASVAAVASSAAPEETAAPVPPPAPVADEVDASPVATAEPQDAAPAPTATTTTTAIATAVAPPPVTNTPPPTFGQPPVAPFTPPPPPPPPSAKPSGDPNAFSEALARTRLGQANGVLAFCKKEGGVTGPGTAWVTFGTDGSVAGIAVDPPYAGTKEGDCVSGQFRRAKVTPFTGAPQTVRHGFEVPK